MTYNTFQLPDVTAAEYIILFEMLLKYNLHVCWMACGQMTSTSF